MQLSATPIPTSAGISTNFTPPFPAPVGISASTDTAPSWVSDLTSIGKGLLSLKQQNDLQQLNYERIRAGKPPLDADAMAAQVKVGMDTKQLNKILLLAAGGLGVLFFALRRNRK